MKKLLSNFQNIRVAPRLMMSFGIILLLFIGYCILIFIELRVLESQTHFIYNYPLKVGFGIREIEADLLRIHREMKKLSLTESSAEIVEQAEYINSIENNVMTLLKDIEKRYLGDPADILELEKAIEGWNPLREEMIQLRLKGDMKTANVLIKEKEAAYVRLLENKIDKIQEFATNRASQILIKSEDTYLKIIYTTIIACLLLLLLSILIALLNIKSIQSPLALLEEGANQMEKGNLDFQIPIISKDEFGHLTAAFNYMSASIKKKNQKLKERNEENEHLLLSILPAPIAERLKHGEEPIADAFGDVSVLFADIVDFTEFSYEYPPRKLVSLLNRLFSIFDEAAHKYGVEKIKTIGDCYMAVCGLIEPREDHADALVKMAREMIQGIRQLNQEINTQLMIRIGIHSGPVVAGIIGKEKFIYDLWGDTVNIASRMETYPPTHTHCCFWYQNVVQTCTSC